LLKNSTDPFNYRYVYGENSVPSQLWIAEDRYLVIDLGAGPCLYGSTKEGEGVFDERSIRKLDQ
jgi:hypothetical protein